MLTAILVLFLPSLSAFAQTDITGRWRPLARNEIGSGMTGDAAGLPILSDQVDGGRTAWSPDEFDMAEWMTKPIHGIFHSKAFSRC